jgi:preprotein translocase subunit SecF
MIKWKEVGKAIVDGFIFGVIAGILSGDASSIVVALLVVYMDLKFLSLEKGKIEEKEHA